MANTYPKGDLVTCSGSFKNGSGQLGDPTTPLFAYRDPLGVWHRDIVPSRTSQGVYTAPVDTSRPSTGQQTETWLYRFYAPSGDTLQAADTETFMVSNPGGF